ncbi:hypothetical protein JOM56_013709 [Amanita muscaria]
MMKRAGRRHDDSGAKKEGLCAILCPACPQPGINLPVNWENAPDDTAWLYTLFLTLDANFRMSRKKVSNEEHDPCLTQNWGYFVDNSDYQDHLKTYGGQRQAPSTCVSHNAVNSADTKDARGLLITGIGTVDCARHDMKRSEQLLVTSTDPSQIWRYVNMDYLFYSGLKSTSIRRMVISYDIACQWSINFETRMQTCFPRTWLVNNTTTTDVILRFLIPKFHLPAHAEKCHQDFSFNYMPKVGRTDGEAPERGWSRMIDLSNSTREMGPGSRQDTIEDNMNDSNWKKVTAMGVIFSRKLKATYHENNIQYQAWKQLSDVLDPQQVSVWSDEVQAWKADATQPNPFWPRLNEPTQAEVRLKLAQKDMQDILKNGSMINPVNCHISPSAMINMGLELEDARCKLQSEIQSLGPHATPLQQAQSQEKLNILYRKLISWFEIQAIYIPAVATLRAQPSPTERFDIPDISITNMELWLPSSIGYRVHCDQRLGEYEWLLQEAQARDSLKGLRQNLRLRDFLQKRKKDWARGVCQNTRSQALINQANTKIAASAAKYCVARIALGQLAPILNKGFLWTSELHELKETDIEGLPVEGWGEGRRTLSWIWMTVGITDESSPPQLIDAQMLTGFNFPALRVQWCHARAHHLRWSEEISLLKEEMRRVLAYCSWYGQWWLDQANRYQVEKHDPLSEGLSAYALHQANIRIAMKEHFTQLWLETPSQATAMPSTVQSSTWKQKAESSLPDTCCVASEGVTTSCESGRFRNEEEKLEEMTRQRKLYQGRVTGVGELQG